MITLPGADRAWSVSYDSDIYGDIVAGKNLDFDKKGYLRLARKAMALFTQNDDADFETPIAIAADNSDIYIITTGGAFKLQVVNELSVSQLSSGSAPTLDFSSDIEFFNGKPQVSGGSGFKTYNSGADTWTSRATDLSSSFPHPMCKNLGSNKLAIADGNVLRQYDSSYVRDTTNELTIPVDYVITRVLYRNGNYYILTRNITGGQASLFLWNGTGTGNNGDYPVLADWIYSGCKWASLIAVITSEGQLLEFNGGGFNELANFPVYYTPWSWTSDASTSNLIGNVASRGMEADGDVIFININGALNNGQRSVAGEYLLEQPSGLWCFDKSAGLYPKAGANYRTVKTLTPVSLDSGALVFGTPHEALTGDAVFCVQQSGITGITGQQTYYAVVDGDYAMKLALSPAQAKANITLTLSGTPGVSDMYAMDSYDSMGSGEVENAGPVFVFKKLVPDLFYGAQVLFGNDTIDNGLDGVGSLMSLGMGRNTGSFTTPKIASASVSEAFQKLMVKYPNMNLDSEEITIKYRLTDRFGTPSHTDFSSSTQFQDGNNAIVDPSTKDVDTLIVGDEIEFITGAAAGYLAHITAIDKTDPASYVITFDETLPVDFADRTDFIAVNWKKYTPVSAASKTNSQNYYEQPIGKPATWIQFKIALQGPGGTTGIEQLMLISGPNKQAA